MAGVSSKALALGEPKNKEKTFQGQRFDDDLGLNWIQFKWRNHDPQIGRFIEVDPLATEYLYNSVFAFSENKITSHVEVEGLEAESIKNFGSKIGKTASNAESNWKSSVSRVSSKVGGEANSAEPKYIPFSESSSFFGSTTTSVSVSKETVIWESPLGDKATTSNYSGQSYGEKGFANMDVSHKVSESGTMSTDYTFSLGSLSVSTDLTGVSLGGEIFPGAEIKGGVTTSNGIVVGTSYTNRNGHIDGMDISFRPGGVSLTAVAVAVGMLVAPEVTIPMIREIPRGVTREIPLPVKQ